MKNIQLTSRTPVLIAVCALLTGTFALFSLQTQAADPKTAPSPKPALTVSVTQPEATTLIVKLSANGNIAAWQEASVGSEAPGLRLAEVRANVGDRVRAGQVLAVFAADAVQADLAQARASLLEAQATAAEAAQNADRARSLQNTGAMSAQQIGQFTTAEQTAKARVASAQAQLASQTLRLKNTQVLAPDAGIVSARSATVGAVPGGAELFRLIRQGRLEWRAEVTSAELARIKPGVVVNVVAANGVQTKGRVRMVAPTVDAQTRAALVYVDLVPAKGGAVEVQRPMVDGGEASPTGRPAT